MPLRHSASRKAFAENVSTLLREGRPRDQALAIAYDLKRRAGARATVLIRDLGQSKAQIARLDRILAKRPVKT